MSKSTFGLSEAFMSWYRPRAFRDTDVLRALREETAALPNANMQIAPEQGAFLGLLVRAMGVRQAVEVGTFTGYSSLCIGGALPADGRLVCCDISEEYTAVARRYWEKAGLADRVTLRLGPAEQSLLELEKEQGRGWLDLLFLDADKTGYDLYYEIGLRLLRPGGVILVDNMFWGGDVADPLKEDPSTLALRALAEKIHGDERVEPALLPIADGLGMALKR